MILLVGGRPRATELSAVVGREAGGCGRCVGEEIWVRWELEAEDGNGNEDGEEDEDGEEEWGLNSGWSKGRTADERYLYYSTEEKA